MRDLAKGIKEIDDERNPDEQERDVARRLGTQCTFHGWFKTTTEERVHDPSIGTYIYRRCYKSMENGYFPFCRYHHDKQDDPREPHPEAKKRGGGPKGGGPKSTGGANLNAFWARLLK